MQLLPWTTIRRLLHLKLTGGIPWLVVVPALAIGIEFANAWFGAPRLPISFVLMFLSAGSFALAAGVYAVACPPDIKEIASADDWLDANAKKRRKILEDLEQSKALKTAWWEQAEKYIEEKLRRRAFTNEQIGVVKSLFKERLQTSANVLGESFERLSKTSTESFEQLEKKNPFARLVCSILLGASLSFLTVVVVLRLITVYHAAGG